MKIVVIGGHARNIGKTSVMAGLLHDLAWLGWAAVKITQYGHGICSQDGQPCKCAPEEHPFVLTEEQDRERSDDTSRFLAAGARRSLWLRVRQGQLGEAFPLLMDALAREQWVMIESNSILTYLQPTLYLMVLDRSQPDFKASAREFLPQADAFVTVRSKPKVPWIPWDTDEYPSADRQLKLTKPTFAVTAGTYINFELCRFIRRRLGLAGPLLQGAQLPLS